MTRIAFVHGRFPAGGAERVTLDIAGFLKKKGGYEIYVYSSRVNESMMTDQIRSVVTVRQLPSQLIQTRRAREIERLVVSDGIDILVQINKPISGIEGITERTGCKSVIACHGEPFWQRYVIIHRRQKGVFRKLMWVLFNRKRFADGRLAMEMAVARTASYLKHCDAYTVLCESYKNEIEGTLGISASESKIYAIENAEPEVNDIVLEKEKMFLFCGRFENWSKRIDRLLRIWSKVQSRLPDWKLVLVGDGPAAGSLRKLAEELKLERVEFEGMKKDVKPYYDRAWAVCLTSETEGWPLVLCEGQAHGCIGMAFGCTSGIAEILGPDGESGFIVPAFDEDLYAETMVRIASLSKEDEMRIRTNSILKRGRYTPDVTGRKWQRLFDMLSE